MSSPLKQALLSRSFARDVSSFAFLFAGLNAVLGLVALSLASSLEVRLDAAGVLAAGLFFAALGWFTRRGSRIALFVTLGMFALDAWPSSSCRPRAVSRARSSPGW